MNGAVGPTTGTAIAARGIWKNFGATVALKGVDLTINRGSIHALVGENGAGKSTLIKVLTGVHRPDRGTVCIEGEETSLRSPQDAIAAGISAVHQERNLVPDFSVAENLFLHRPPRRLGFLDYRHLWREAEVWLQRVGLVVDPRLPARRLSAAQGQLLEIARALAIEARVLLLDEPTASITDREAELLFQLLRDLRDRGGAILFVSHKLPEIFALCDRVTVIRDGETVLPSAPREGITQTTLVTAMVGRSVTQREHQPRPPTSASATLELHGLSTRFGHRNISLSLFPGRIAGLYGLVGAGRTELARVLLGLEKVTGGELRIRGKVATVSDPNEALYRHSIGYISEDRKGEGLVLSQSIAHNVGVTIWDRLSRAGIFISDDRQREAVEPTMKQVQVKCESPSQAVGQLSGGNQQKVSVAKWLESEADLLIIDEPTIGVDIRTKEEIYDLVEKLAGKGKTILLISSDLAEMIRLADDIFVIANKRLVGNIPNSGGYSVVSEQVMEAIVRAAPAEGR